MGYLRHKKHPWRNGLLTAAVVLPALYALVGFLVLPPIARAQAEKRLAAELRRPVTIAKVRLNPFTLSVTVEGFEVRERDGSAPFVGWERLFVNLEASSLWSDEWRFAAIELDAPHGRVVAGKEGALNFSDLLEGGAAAGEAAGAPAPAIDEAAGPAAPPVHIASLVLNRARLEFRDEGRAQPFATTLGPVSLRVSDFRTVNEGNAPYTFEAMTESGEKLSWRGGIRSAPFRSRGELTVSNIVLKKYSPYYAGRTGLEIKRGLLTVHGRYDFNLDARSRVIRLLDGALDLRDLEVVERATGAPVLDLPRAEIKGATADGLALSADVREISVTGGRLNLRREKDGSVNLLELLAPEGGEAADAGAGPAGATGGAAGAREAARSTRGEADAGTDPDRLTVEAASVRGTARSTPGEPAAVALTVGELAVREFSFALEDRVPATPARLAAERVHFSLREFTLAKGARMPLQLALDWQPAGAVRVNGSVSLQPLAADLQVELDGFAMVPLNPYLAEHAAVRLDQGLVSLGGRASLERPDAGAPAGSFEGQAWLERFALVAATDEREFAGFSDLVVSGIKVATAPQVSAQVAEINLTGPKLRAVVKGDGTLNLAGLLKEKRETTPGGPERATDAAPPVEPPVLFAGGGGAEPAAAAAAPLDLEIGRVVLADGELDFTDESLQPGVRFGVTALGGTITGLSAANPGRGAVDLAARVGGAPLAIKGRLDPLAANPSLDVQVDLLDLDLRPLSPYSGKYAGFELARGRLKLDLDAKLADRRLDTTNVVTLDSFTFGNATGSPDATKLPVRLGVALLKDTQGLIVIDVPVQGSLDDPEFRIGRVVWRVIGNLLTKAATSPFALLGAMFGGGGDELGWQEFAPGETALTAEGIRKLAALAKALNERPALTLKISGGWAREADAAAIRSRKLEAAVQAAWRERALAADPAAVIAPDAVMPEEERAAAVKHLFDRRFPPGTELGTPLPPAPPILSRPPPEERHWVRKVLDWVLNSEDRRAIAFRKEQEEIQRKYLEQAKLVVEAGLPLEVMLERLGSAEPVDEAELIALATARREAVRDHLVSVGEVGLVRLILDDTVEPVPEAEVPVAAEATASGEAAATDEPVAGTTAEAATPSDVAGADDSTVVTVELVPVEPVAADPAAGRTRTARAPLAPPRVVLQLQ